MKDDNNVEVLILDKDLEERFNKDRKERKNLINKHVNRKKRVKMAIYYLILLILLGAFLFSGYKVVTWLIENYKTHENAAKLRKLAKISGGNSEYANVNFKKLLKENEDTVAWIKINGTQINYPVVQAQDNHYYLYHAFDRTYNTAGWIFSDYRNNFKEIKGNNVLYGHGRLDGSMFGSLKNVFDGNWLKDKKNYKIKLSTPKYKSIWKIFSTYTIKAETYYITTDFATADDFQEFIDTISQRSTHDFNTEVTKDDKILTLSTCKNDYGDRIAVHAKLIKKIKN